MKSTNTKKTKKNVIIAALFIIGAGIALCLSILLLFPTDKRADWQRLSTERYDTVFLSMYPADYYLEEDFAHYRALTTVKASHELSGLFDIKSYIKCAGRSGNTISTIYLAAQPEKLSGAALSEILQAYPSVKFEIILPNPSLEYWTQLSDTACKNTLQAYYDFAAPLLQQTNCSVYFFGSKEWLIANPANYESDFLTNPEVTRNIMLQADPNHAYLLTLENIVETFDMLRLLIEQSHTAPYTYADLSDYDIIFLGDSVIGNYTNSFSIPGVVQGLTGAHVYNLGYGGETATEGPTDNCSLPDIVNALLQQNTTTLPQGTQVLEGMTEYLQDAHQQKLCFVINYGLNDYFIGLPIASADPYDVHTYSGALRTAIQALKTAYPDAKILLQTPNFTTYFGNGTEYRSEYSHTLEDYAAAVLSIAEEMNVYVLDNFNELGINADNQWLYLADGCHPNELGRFLIGRRIALKANEF